jgi:4-amino-4-deoxy-L-arabinose transferase-like glycosyltransferase
VLAKVGAVKTMKGFSEKMLHDNRSKGIKNSIANGKFSKAATYVVLVIAGIIAVAMVLASTSPYGVGVSSDAVSYISTAEHLLAGEGYLDYDRRPYVHWPPLFPTILALLGLAGIKPVDGARYINAISFGLIVFSCGVLFLRRIKSKLLVVVGAVAVLMCFTLLQVSVYAWTEPLFIFLTVLFMFNIVRFLNERKISALILAGVCTALACLQRYMGVTVIITGLFLVVFFVRNCGLLKRLKYAAIFGSIASVPLGLWVLRNKIATSTAGDFYLQFDPNFYHETTQTFNLITQWFITDKIALAARLVIVGIVICSLAAVVILRRYKSDKKQLGDAMLGKAAVAFILIYTFFNLFAATFVYYVFANERIMLPIYIFTVLLLLIGLEDSVELLTLLLRKRAVSLFIIVGLCSLWLLLYPFPIVRQRISIYRKYGVSGLTSAFWSRSPLTNWLKNYPYLIKGTILSNDPHAIRFLSKLHAIMSLRRSDNIAEFKRLAMSGQNNYLVWYYGKEYWNKRRGFYNLRELNSMFKLKPVVVLQDGAVFEIE